MIKIYCQHKILFWLVLAVLFTAIATGLNVFIYHLMEDESNFPVFLFSALALFSIGKTIHVGCKQNKTILSILAIFYLCCIPSKVYSTEGGINPYFEWTDLMGWIFIVLIIYGLHLLFSKIIIPFFSSLTKNNKKGTNENNKN